MAEENGRRRVNAAATRSRRQARSRQGGQVSVTSSGYDTEYENTELLEDRVFPPGVEPAFVRVGAGVTRSLGNYESLRVDVGVTLPCLPSEVDAAFSQASGIVAERLDAEVTQWLGSSNKRGAR